jgi:hypothetical protein
LWRIFSCFYCKLEKKRKKGQIFSKLQIEVKKKKKKKREKRSPLITKFSNITKLGKEKNHSTLLPKLKHITAPPLPLQQTTKQSPKTDLK